MAAESNEKLMLNWFQTQTMKSLQEQQKTGILESPLLLKTVGKAICRSFERISGARNARLFFDLDTHRLVLEFVSADGNAQRFAMDEMSDGSNCRNNRARYRSCKDISGFGENIGKITHLSKRD